MTQQEYDKKMYELNNKFIELTAPMRKQMQKIEQQKSVIDLQIDELRSKSRELGSQYYGICAQVKELKNKIQALKHEVYMKRPDRDTQ